ncbi:MAG TPA: hypothetical protein VKT30_03430 [Caulobacteraceae bacterium]|nr:hypothetical protein [Caulobacteraceae bacterium]
MSGVPPAPPRLHVTGASGCGVSTLGAALATRLGAAHLDTDAFYWRPSDPPYQHSRPVPERLSLIEQAMTAPTSGWALSGSLCGWGDPLIPRFERVIFLSTTTEVRLARLQARERARYGDAIAPGGPLEQQHNDFMAFAIGYETGVFTGSLTGRHRALHEAWLAGLPCPVVRLDAALPTAALVEAVVVG